MALILGTLALTSTLIPSVANAAYVQWVSCPDGSGGTRGVENLRPMSNGVRLLPSSDPSGQGGARLEFDIRADYLGEATCAELLGDGPSDMTVALDALDVSDSYVVRPSNWTCLPYGNIAAGEQHYLADRGSKIRLVAQLDLGLLGLLPTFAAQVSFSASNKSDSPKGSFACIYSEVTPQLREDVSTAVQRGSVAVFLLVFVSGLLATLFAPAVAAVGRSSDRIGSGPHGGASVPWAILPGVADCLLHLQFIFFLGALTLRYPGFYQPLTSLFHWFALFSPAGPFGQDWRYQTVNDGIYEVNGTLTGSYGLELMSQITGGPVTMDVWWNMVVIAAIITAVVAVFVIARGFISRFAPSLSFSMPVGEGPDRRGLIFGSAIAHGTWNVLRVVLSYFLTPIVAISAYQLDHVILPARHLALASLLIVLVIVSLTWMWRIAPSNQLGVMLLDSSKRYRLVGTDDADGDDESDDSHPAGKNRDLFAAIFFALAFARGIAVGGFQFSPLAQVVGLATTELALVVSTAVLRPLSRRVLSVFTWSGIARLVVVALTAVFLPELDASISLRSRVGIAILVIHAAVLVLGCAVPAAVRLASLVYLTWTRPPADEPRVYGLDQLRRRNNAVNDLSSVDTSYPISESTYNPRGTGPPDSHRHGHSPHMPSDTSSLSFYVDRNWPTDAIYLRAVPQHHYFRQPHVSTCARLGRSCAANPSNISAVSSTTPLTLEPEPSSPEGGGSSHSSTTPSSTITPRKPLRSSTFGLTGTVSHTAEQPLGPHWSDYSFREADLYYGQNRPQRAEDSGGAPAPAPQPQPQPSTVRHVMSSMRGRLTGRKSGLVERHPPPKGFEVRRPPRPANV